MGTRSAKQNEWQPEDAYTLHFIVRDMELLVYALRGFEWLLEGNVEKGFEVHEAMEPIFDLTDKLGSDLRKLQGHPTPKASTVRTG